MNKTIYSLILASIFIVPIATIIPIKGTIVWYPQLLAMLIIGFTFLSINIWNFNKAIAIFTLYLLFSYIFVCQTHPRSMLCLICAYAGCYISYFASKIDSTSLPIRAIACMALINFILLLSQFFGFDPFFHPDNKDFGEGMVGFMGSHNQLAIYSAAVAPFLYVIEPFLILFSICGIILSKTSSAFIALAMGLLFYFLINKTYKLLIISSLLLIALGAFWFNYDRPLDAFKERFDIWKLSASQVINGQLEIFGTKQKIKCNPLTGFGLGNFLVLSPNSQMKVLPPSTGHVYEHAHNDLVESFFEFGYIGLGLVLLMIFTVIRDFLKSYKTNKIIILFTSLVIMFFCSFGVYVAHAPVSYFMFMLILGLFYAEVNHENKSAGFAEAKRVN